MIDPKHRKVPLTRQCRLIGLARSTAYHQPRRGPDKDAPLRNRIDELYTKWPFFGSRQMRDRLRREGWDAGRKRVCRLMRLMGLQAQCPKPNLSRPARGHKIYPYLMKGLTVDRPNKAWCADITYIRMEQGFMYLVAVMDWHSRKVLSWELSNTLGSGFCCRALEEAVRTHGVPEVFNTDQGCQFTSSEWIGALKGHGIRISMDGRGRALDNAFVERLWRSLKYEEVYRREYHGVADLRHHLGVYFEFYNHERPHSSLERHTPAEIHDGVPTEQAA
jgi:putative transposase